MNAPASAKRQAAVEKMQTTENYIIVYYLLPAQLPQEPNPFERMSKRRWEFVFMIWRRELSRIAAGVDLTL